MNMLEGALLLRVNNRSFENRRDPDITEEIERRGGFA